MESVSVPSAENKSVFSRLWNRFSLKKATSHKQDKDQTTTTITAATTTNHRLSVSSSGSNNSELESVFTYFDEDGDGKVSPAELRRCMKAVGGELTMEEAEMAVRLSDSDGDGLLGLEDFTKLMEEERNKESELIGAFAMYEEMEGYITPKSLKRMLSRLVFVSTAEKVSFFSRLQKRFSLKKETTTTATTTTDRVFRSIVVVVIMAS
ncbi:hypothetical protein K7X08_027891 [Anisodus acutangulus]|uniref:EF-hand domain-containing protein n=1 Tax=Anisodus acutangulus TaxID=402998 RepID=A0A9Q1MU31_9SOLA|nr:hypothetical protein K7X08_027891 [Anisodus acutangulus]